MVKMLNSTISLILASTLSIAIVACNSEVLEEMPITGQKHECLLVLNPNESTRSTGFTSFKDGDKLYFYFKGENKFSAVATYGADDNWILSYDATLSSGQSGLCNVIHTKGGELQTTEYDYYKINSKTALYGTSDGMWEYANGAMTVYAQLKPLQTKIQFISDKPTEIMVKGFQFQDYFLLSRMFHFSYDDGIRPCVPQRIEITNKLENGKYASDELYIVGVGSDLYIDSSLYGSGYVVDRIGCTHYKYKSDGETFIYEPCTLGDNIYIYDTQNTSKCYRRKNLKSTSNGSNIIINVPTPTSHDGWEMIDNQIKIIDNEPTGVYIKTGITNPCGFSVNFSVRKNYYYESDCLSVDCGFEVIFRMIKRHDSWENYSAITRDVNMGYQIIFTGKSGDASVSPYNYFKNISYSHFPYYGELVEEWE